jgi:hypothetical protein
MSKGDPVAADNGEVAVLLVPCEHKLFTPTHRHHFVTGGAISISLLPFSKNETINAHLILSNISMKQ